MRIAVYGTGYLGATHAACMAELGHEVIGVDVDPVKLSKLEAGELPFFEPGLEVLVRRHNASGQLRFTSDYRTAAAFADAHFIGVGTPQRPDSPAADMRYVDAVIDQLSPMLTKPTVIFGKSTVPVGTAARLARRAAQLATVEVEVAWNPEFLREGFAVEDTLHPDRIVLGVDRSRHVSRAEDLARQIYSESIASGSPFLVTDLATAELTKVAANSFLAVKISYINAIAEICDLAGADVTALADAIGHDSRIGRRFLNAGLGFGGGCLPKDIRAFQARAEELGARDALALLAVADDLNSRQRTKVINLLSVLVGPLNEARITVLGAAFKPNTDDIRDSPALDVVARLASAGATVRLYDPKAMENAAAAVPDLEIAGSAVDACKAADAVLVLTEWPEFADLDPVEVGRTAEGRIVIDARNCLDPKKWQAAGWTYRGIGRR